MDEKKRIKRVIQHQYTDCIPWQINCTSQLAERLVEELQLPKNAEEGIRIDECMNVDLGGCTTWENTGEGVVIAQNSSDISVRKGSQDSNGGYGIRIDNASDVRIEGELDSPQNIVNNVTGGVLVEDAQNVAIGAELDQENLTFLEILLK